MGKSLYRVLAEIFDDTRTDAVRRVLRDAEIDPNRVDLSGNALDVWFRVEEEAVKLDVARHEGLGRDLAALHLDHPREKPRLGARHRRAPHPHVVPQDAIADEGDALARRPDVPGVQPQTELPARLLDRPRRRHDRRAVVAEDHHVVHVAEVGAHAEPVFHDVIDGVEVAVRPELRREVAEREPHLARVGREEVVAGHVGAARLGHARAQDAVAERAHPRLAQVGGDVLADDGVVDRGEEAFDVEVGVVRVGSRPGGRATRRSEESGRGRTRRRRARAGARWRCR